MPLVTLLSATVEPERPLIDRNGSLPECALNDRHGWKADIGGRREQPGIDFTVNCLPDAACPLNYQGRCFCLEELAPSGAPALPAAVSFVI